MALQSVKSTGSYQEQWGIYSMRISFLASLQIFAAGFFFNFMKYISYMVWKGHQSKNMIINVEYHDLIKSSSNMSKIALDFAVMN